MSNQYRISTNQVQIRHNQEKKSIKHLKPLPDQRAFIIYSSWEQNENDIYMICNLRTGQILSTGPFCTKAEKLENLNDDIIIFVDSSNQKLKAFSIEKEEYLTFNDINAPSLQALPQNQRNIEVIGDAISDLSIVCFPHSKSIAVLEKRQAQNQNYADYILTAYCFDEGYLNSNQGESRIAQIQSNQQNQNKMLGKLKQQDVLIIAPPQFSDNQQSKFLVWNFSDKTMQKQLQQISLNSTVDGTIINITDWQKPEQLAFWVNGKPNKPQIIVYDTQSKIDFEHTLKMYSNYFLIVEVFEVNFECERIIMNIIPETQNSCIDIINPIKNQITYTQNIDNSEDSTQFSSDSRYFVTCLNNYDVMGEACSDSQESILTIHSVIGIKTSLMNFLIKKDIIQKYGEEASKSIIDMLTEDPNEHNHFHL